MKQKAESRKEKRLPNIIGRDAVPKLLLLHVLSKEPLHIGEIISKMATENGRVLSESGVRRTIRILCDGQMIEKSSIKKPGDQRKRTFYCATRKGKAQLGKIQRSYNAYTAGIQEVLSASAEIQK